MNDNAQQSCTNWTNSQPGGSSRNSKWVSIPRTIHTISLIETKIQRWICGRAGVLLKNIVTYWGALYCFVGDGLSDNW